MNLDIFLLELQNILMDGMWNVRKRKKSREFPDNLVFVFPASTAGGTVSISAQGTKIPHVVWYSQSKKKERKNLI